MSKVAVMAGAGPGNGAALARRFAREGYAVGLLARNADYLDELAGELRRAGHDALAVPTDLADGEAVQRALADVAGRLGPVEVLLQNAAPMVRGAFLELEPERFETAFRVAVMGMVHCCRAVLPDMQRAGRGAVVLIGATGAIRGGNGFSAFAAAKFGQRALAQSLAREFGPQGIHVAHVVIDGVVETPTTRQWLPDRPQDVFLQPDDVADAVWHLVRQPRSAWSHEIDLRPYGEKW